MNNKYYNNGTGNKNNDKDYVEDMALYAKKLYHSGVRFEKVIEAVMERTVIDYQFCLALECAAELRDLFKKEEKEKGRGRNERQ